MLNKFFNKYHYFILILILFFAFLTRIWRLHVPERYIFDEVYHVVTAKLIAKDDARAYQWWNPAPEPNTAVDWLHPPLAKYTQAFFINLFGETSFAWRFSSVIFGVLVILAVYKLSNLLFANKNLSLLAAFLASLDGLLLVQSRIAMNDIHVTFFILLTLIFYLRYLKNKNNKKLLVLTGLSAGIAMGCKWSGVFGLLIVLICQLLIFAKGRKFSALTLIKNFLFLIILPVIIYISSYSHMIAQGHSLFCFEKKQIQTQCYFEKIKLGKFEWQGYISHFAMLHRQIWHYQTHLKATHGYQSRPYQWFLNLRPVWYHVDYIDQDYIANIYAQGNSLLYWAGDIAIIFSLIFLVYFYVKNKKLKLNLLFLILAYFIVWLPWQLSPRIMFFYHYTPAVPLLCIILAYWLIKLLKLNKYILILILFLIILNFLIFYPNWTALPVSKNFADQIYFAIASFK